MRNRHVWYILGAVTITVLVTLGLGCGAATPAPSKPAPAVTKPTATPIVKEEPTATPEEEVVLTIVGSSASARWGVDPAIINATSVPGRQAYERLIRYKAGTNEFEGVLATEWESNDDLTEYTFKLREGVKFCDGTTFDANAVKFGYERAVGVDEFAATYWQPVKVVEVVDELTVKIVMHKPTPYWLASLAAPWGHNFFVSPAYVKEHATDDDPWATAHLFDHSCGTGPYQVEEFIPDERVVMVKNPHYWRGWDIPHVTRLNMPVLPESETRRQMMETGEADYWTAGTAIPIDWALEMEKDPDITVEFGPTPRVFTLYFNTRKPYLNDINIRKAIQHTWNWEKANELIWLGQGRRARGVFPSDLWSFDPTVPFYEYDIDKAKEYLAKAGYPDGGFSLNIQINMDTPDWAQATLVLKEGLEQVGIDLEIESKTWSEVYAQVTRPLDEEREYDISGLWYFPVVADPHFMVERSWHSKFWGPAGGYNYSLYDNPELDALIDAAEVETDLQKRKEMYSKLQHIIQDSAVGLYTFEQPVAYVYRKWVKNPPVHTPLDLSFAMPSFYGVYIEGRP